MAANVRGYSRIDVLRQTPGGQFDLIEVKAATRVKAYHIEDMAFQYHVFISAGFSIRTCCMMLIDSSYVRRGELELEKLFQFCDISHPVLARQTIWKLKISSPPRLIPCGTVRSSTPKATTTSSTRSAVPCSFGSKATSTLPVKRPFGSSLF